MKIETKYLGEVVIEEENIIRFEAGLPGFDDEVDFVLLDLAENDAFQILQSVKTSNLAFVVTNPHLYYPEYEFTLEQPVIDALKIESEKSIAILSVLTLKDPFKESTINLQAPIIINNDTKYAKQYILNNDQFNMRARITETEAAVKGED
ncbi:MAG TPA: flagellar assembly protein FliW [Pseudogracilibacillus sp.]|nr:flagellar assembly protein FliW [Pseudogracilibacillus sp.]